MPLISTAAVIGFGGVVTQTQGFQQFASLVTESAPAPAADRCSPLSALYLPSRAPRQAVCRSSCKPWRPRT